MNPVSEFGASEYNGDGYGYERALCPLPRVMITTDEKRYE